MGWLLLTSLLCLGLPRQSTASAAAIAADSLEPVIAPTVTHHQIRLGQESVRYRATFAERVLQDTTGRPQATMSATAYEREGVRDLRTRPVLFVFNGGPGASSSPLHFGALGPRRRTAPDSSGVRRMIDNPQSPLDIVDLVFIDPVGTGLSRVLPGGDGHAWWGVHGDATAVREFIQDWLRDHDRESSPVYICGESYGGFRLATMMADVGPLRIAGLILISPMLDASSADETQGNDAPYLFHLPSMAAAAWHHGRASRGAPDAATVFADAARFAQGDYALALYQGSRLPAAERERIADRLSAFIGLPRDTILAHDLRVDVETFLTALLADRGLRIGRLDARATGDAALLATRRPPLNDPSMTMTTGKGAALDQYFAQELGVHTSRSYVTLSLDVNGRWNWADTPWAGREFYVNPTPAIGRMMAAQPDARVMLVGGYFDLATPYFAARYALDHAGVPPERVTLAAFPGGHSAYDDEANLRGFVREVRAFVHP